MRLCLLTLSLMLTGCYVPSGYHRVDARIVSAYQVEHSCYNRLDADGWTRIICPEEPKQKQPLTK